MRVVDFNAVSKTYLLEESHGRRLAATLFPKLVPGARFTALKDVTFDVRGGETFCIIGRNGAGKSTLLELVAGISQPSTGSVRVAGRVSALLELGMGFHPDFTGRQNVLLSAAILGFSAAETRQIYPHVARFADIGEFIDRPVRTYSSGMLMRLAFAIAIHVDPEILIVDEALSVGDLEFRQRCLRKVQELRARGVSILFVSHSMGEVKSIGDRALWLDAGRPRQLGPAGQVADAYLAELSGPSGATSAQPAPEHRTPRRAADPVPALPSWLDNLTFSDARRGDGRARLYGFGLFETDGRPAACLQPQETYLARLSFQALQDLAHPQAAVLVRNHLGLDFSGVSTTRCSSAIPPLAKGQRVNVELRFRLPKLYPGFFSFSPSVFDAASVGLPRQACDWVDNVLTLQMEKAGGQVYGSFHVPARIVWAAPTLSQESQSA